MTTDRATLVNELDIIGARAVGALEAIVNHRLIPAVYAPIADDAARIVAEWRAKVAEIKAAE